MNVYEKKIGRFFRFEFTNGEDILALLSGFAREKGIREASLLIVGAMQEGEAVTGFKNLNGGPFDSELEKFKKREFLGLGNLIWPEKPPKSMVRKGVSWDEPQPYPHFHFAAGPQLGEKERGNLVGHLEKGLASGVTVLLYELI
ncbi:MAG: DUF296 domain-containing protein [Candidatus Omnitrophota bacterium]